MNLRDQCRKNYEDAITELTGSLQRKELEPKEVQDISSFFYDLALCKYAIRMKDEPLKKKCKSCFLCLADVSLITTICEAVQCVFGDEDDPQHLSLYALKGFRTEIVIILFLLKRLLRNPSLSSQSCLSESLNSIYENYSKDLSLESSY